jgi:hypothetical protein
MNENVQLDAVTWMPVKLDAGDGRRSRFELVLDLVGEPIRQRIADALAPGSPVAVWFRMPDVDVEGHSMVAGELILDVLLDAHDVEGHAVRLRFPTREEAAAFRRALVEYGRVDGSLTLQQGGSKVALRPGAPMMPPTHHRG